jgi:mercuric ion transport protein
MSVSSSKVQKASLAGSVLSAMFAAVCCLGPIFFAVLGISGAGFILKFEQYRPLFIAVAVALLGAAFYFTYRKMPAEECAPGSYCANPKSDRINKIVLWVATFAVAFFIFFPNFIGKFLD